MACSISLYHDQVKAGGRSGADLPAAHRLVYVRHGEVEINGARHGAGSALYAGDAVRLAGVADWSQVWRWELAPPNMPPALLDGENLLSMLRMSRVISTLSMVAGSQWLFRLDRITVTPGRVADRHQHPGPGIRCLLEGTFNVQQAAESMRDCVPGDAWWETGSDTVVAWGSRAMSSQFLRGLVLPTECQGAVTGTWLAGQTTAPRPGSWKLLIDQIVTV
jgi:hypothetical protein